MEQEVMRRSMQNRLKPLVVEVNKLEPVESVQVDFAKCDDLIYRPVSGIGRLNRITTSKCMLDISHVSFPKFGSLNKLLVSMIIRDGREAVVKHVEIETSLTREGVAVLLKHSALVEPKNEQVEYNNNMDSYCMISFNEKVTIIIFSV